MPRLISEQPIDVSVCRVESPCRVTAGHAVGDSNGTEYCFAYAYIIILWMHVGACFCVVDRPSEGGGITRTTGATETHARADPERETHEHRCLNTLTHIYINDAFIQSTCTLHWKHVFLLPRYEWSMHACCF